MGPESNILSGGKKIQKATNCVIPLIRNVQDM